jgi:hypothetical protein
MANILKIKRTTGNGNPASTLQGELFYVYDTGLAGGSSANRLFIGDPTTPTNAPLAIGGTYFTGIIDAATSSNTINTLVLRDGSGNFSAGVITADLTGTASSATNATNSVNVAVTANDTANETVYPLFADAQTGNRPAETDLGLNYNPSTGVLTAVSFSGAITGNADTATALATSRNFSITGSDGTASAVGFDGTANVALSFALATQGAFTPGAFGSSTLVPTVTVNSKGIITDITTNSISTTLAIQAQNGAGTPVGVNQSIALGSETLVVKGTTGEIEVIAAGTDTNTLVIGLPDDVTINGNLTVNGTTTTINSTVVTIDDPIFTLGGDTALGADDNLDKGILYQWFNVSAKKGFFGYDDSAAVFTFIPDATETSAVISGAAGPALFGSLSLDTALPVSSGGTGVGTFTDNGIVYGDGTNALDVTAAGTWDGTNSIGQILSVNASGIPTWTNTIDGGTY